MRFTLLVSAAMVLAVVASNARQHHHHKGHRHHRHKAVASCRHTPRIQAHPVLNKAIIVKTGKKASSTKSPKKQQAATKTPKKQSGKTTKSPKLSISPSPPTSPAPGLQVPASPAPVPAPAPVVLTPAPSPPPPVVASPPAASPPASGLSAFAQAALTAHNTFRAQHGAAALTWSEDISDKAQSWVDRCVFAHSGGTLGPFGENIAAGQSDIQDAVDAWTISKQSNGKSEEDEYDPSNPVFSHFTQVVWKGSKQVGCAVQQCDIFKTGRPVSYFSCDYLPAGNVRGQFPQNVQV